MIELFPRCSKSFLSANETPNLRQIPNSDPKPNKRRALGTSLQGKTQSVPRIIIRFTGYRVRPLDPDNFAGSVKDLLDALRYAHLVDGDEPWRIKLETEQEKVKSYAEERIMIEIETL